MSLGEVKSAYLSPILLPLWRSAIPQSTHPALAPTGETWRPGATMTHWGAKPEPGLHTAHWGTRFCCTQIPCPPSPSNPVADPWSSPYLLQVIINPLLLTFGLLCLLAQHPPKGEPCCSVAMPIYPCVWPNPAFLCVRHHPILHPAGAPSVLVSLGPFTPGDPSKWKILPIFSHLYSDLSFKD